MHKKNRRKEYEYISIIPYPQFHYLKNQNIYPGRQFYLDIHIFLDKTKYASI